MERQHSRPPDAEKDEARGEAGFRDQHTNNDGSNGTRSDAQAVNPTGSAASTPLDKKLESTLIAKAAMRGISVQPSTDDREQAIYVVSRWALCRTCTPQELRGTLARMGVE